MKELFTTLLNSAFLGCKTGPELVANTLTNWFSHKIIVRWTKNQDQSTVIYTFHKRPNEDCALEQIPVKLTTYLTDRGVISKLHIEEIEA